MTSWLLDTNVVSELRKPRPSQRVSAFIREQAKVSLHISVITIAEILYGIDRQADPDIRADLTRWLAVDVRPLFEGRVLALSEHVMFRWRIMIAEAKQARYTPPEPDFLIAATAVHYGLTVVTRDIRGFARCSVAVLDPWR